jgi:hypothetical protein
METILCKALKIKENCDFKLVHYMNKNQNEFLNKIYYIKNNKINCKDGSEFDNQLLYKILSGIYSIVEVT